MRQRYHDQVMGFIRASSTLMLKIMILKSVSMPTVRCSNHMETMLLKDCLEMLNVDDQLKATSKDHPAHKASHQESTADNTTQRWLEDTQRG